MSAPDSIEDAYRGDRPWRTLLALYAPERRSAALAILFFVIKASPVWVLPVVTANIIDIIAYRSEGGLRSLWINAGVALFLVLQNIPTNLLYADHLSRAIRNVEVRLRSALVRRLQMLSMTYHTNVSTAALQTKVLRDVESIEQLSRPLIDTGLGAIISILVAIAVTAWRMPLFLPVFALIVPLVMLIRHTMSGRLQQHNKVLRQQLEMMNSRVLGMISMIPVTRAHAAEAEEIERVDRELGNVRTAGRSFDRFAGLFGAITWATFMVFNIACLTAGAWLSYRKVIPISPGDVVLLTGYLNTIVSSVMQLNSMLPIITRGFDGVRSIGEVLESPDLEENRGKPPVKEVRGEFRFENVTFSYASEENAAPALAGVTFTVAPGETIGIVGASGSGKSTLATLITGFHKPSAGRLLLDGRDLQEIDLRSYRTRLAIVTQETILFDGTLRENILYGARGVREERLWSAIEAANAGEFIRQLPRGLETEIGERGVNFSGGQRQRLAIARALLREPRVLILDEATSALDSSGEAIVQQALERLMRDRTTFVIAHRLSTLQNVHRILILEHGTIVQQGTPAQLAADSHGHYAKLLQAQTLAAVG